MWEIVLGVVFLAAIVALAVLLPKSAASFDNVTWDDDIRPLFRQKDIDAMKARGMDLSDKATVSRNADIIYSSVASGSMPCDSPWSSQKVDLFGAWIANGKK